MAEEGTSLYGASEEAISVFAARYGAWPHQVEALRCALQRNTILSLPTGTGKTLVACMLLDALHRRDTVNGADGAITLRHSLFVVNARPLVVQQGRYIRQNSWERLSVHELGGEGADDPCPDVILGTAETLRAALETQRILVENLNVVVFDEAHYAVGRHPYAEILELIWSNGGNPRILGLTASFLHGALVDPEKKRDALEQRMRAELISPEVTGPQTAHKFYPVPWAPGTGDLSYTEVAAYVAHADSLINAARQRFENWELQSIIDKEKSSAQAVLVGLGSLGLHYFLQSGLLEVVGARLVNKMTYVEDPVIKQNLQGAVRHLPEVAQQLAAWMGSPTELLTTGKCDALLNLLDRLLPWGCSDKAIVFVERVALASPLACILAARFEGRVAHICGVQAMDELQRNRSLSLFRGEAVQILVATTALEEGLDVPACRYVVRYDWFSSVKSHVQGAGRARHPNAEVYYFENDPSLEQQRRQVAESVARGITADVPNADEAQKTVEASAAVTVDHALTAGVGTGHAWGAEETMWDYRMNASFRGACCTCGARLHIASRKYGRGRKKTERTFSIEGPWTCPCFQEPPDPRFLGGEQACLEEAAPAAGTPPAESNAAAACFHAETTPGEGEGHSWGQESTMWDKLADKSFRGKECQYCSAKVHITSTMATCPEDPGKKTKQRQYTVVGPNSCPGPARAQSKAATALSSQTAAAAHLPLASTPSALPGKGKSLNGKGLNGKGLNGRGYGPPLGNNYGPPGNCYGPPGNNYGWSQANWSASWSAAPRVHG